MAEIIDFEEIAEREVVAAAYNMTFELDGATRAIELTGEELFETTCPKCGRTITLCFSDFINVMHGGDLYSVMVL